MLDDKLLIDFYVGLGFGYCNYANAMESEIEFYHYGYTVFPLIPLATTGGLRIGYLLKSSNMQYDRKSLMGE